MEQSIYSLYKRKKNNKALEVALHPLFEFYIFFKRVDRTLDHLDEKHPLLQIVLGFLERFYAAPPCSFIHLYKTSKPFNDKDFDVFLFHIIWLNFNNA